MLRHLIDLDDFTAEDWKSVVRMAIDIRTNPDLYWDRCRGKILATLFYEPSTRTQMSFQAAMLRLGGRIIGFDNPMNSSVSKGETLRDTIRIISGYSDVIAIRHPLDGSARAASFYSSCPIINAGDGSHLHPTQTLTDLVALTYHNGTVENLTVGICGDLKYGRTTHSLIKVMCKFGCSFVFISTPQLAPPDYIKDYITDSGCSYAEESDLELAIPKLDVLYMTRIQKERFRSEAEYLKQKDSYVLDMPKLNHAKPSLKIMHPLPRVDEIDIRVDDDPRAIYFDQAVCGMYARMALIVHMLSSRSMLEAPPPAPETVLQEDFQCGNEKCVTRTEKYLPHRFVKHGDGYACEYCERKV